MMTAKQVDRAVNDITLRAVSSTPLPSSNVQSTAVYIHVPFCHHRCAYCDFNIYADQPALHEAYVRTVAEEVASATSRIGRVRVPTIYFGGGTPSLLAAELIGGLLTTLHTFFQIDTDAEITLELNPMADRARSIDYLGRLRALGVNRLSLGVQSSHAGELHLLRRGHSFEDAVRTFEAARNAGFDNVNVDLIYGLPAQPIDRWRETLRRVIDLRPDHVSAYSLQVEERTALFNWVRDGKVSAPDEEVVAEMYEAAQAMLAGAGFEHYEISNWARQRPRDRVDEGWKAGFRSRHNLVYWRNEPYFGFGCGAHSSVSDERYWNVVSPRDYIRAIEERGEAVAGRELISRELAIGETLMLGLRLIDEGVDRARFAHRFGVELETVFGGKIVRLIEQGLIESRPDRIRLTPRGRLLGNRVFAEFLP